MLILGHLSRASCLTEICDDADLNRRKLSLVRNATPGKRNTFSHANRTRPAEDAEEVYWETRQPEKSERKPMKSGLPQTNYAPMGC